MAIAEEKDTWLSEFKQTHDFQFIRIPESRDRTAIRAFVLKNFGELKFLDWRCMGGGDNNAEFSISDEDIRWLVQYILDKGDKQHEMPMPVEGIRVITLIDNKEAPRYDPDRKTYKGYRQMPNCAEKRFSTFYIPTEMVISSPQMVMPQVGRVYETGLVEYKGNAYHCNEYRLRTSLEWWGVKETPVIHELSVVEDWRDGGDDGHTDYSLCGYVIARTQDVQFITEHLKRYEARHDVPYPIDIEYNKE